MRLFGNIEAKIDAKGRAFLPASFRKVLQASGEERLFLHKDIYQHCVVIYPESIWNKQMDVVRSSLNQWNRQHQLIFRQFVSEVEMLTLDGNGRFLIPKRFLKWANIEQSIRFIGMDTYIEIWRKDEEDKPFMDAEEFANAFESILGNPFLTPLSGVPLNESRQE